jgi:hypothetical protein
MNLSINEQLMQDTKDANLCIFIANLATWIKFNASKDDPNERNFHDGHYWSYNTLKDFVNYFGFWSIRNIRTIIANCIKLDLIKTANFNKKKYDNTIWYTLTEKGLKYYPALSELVLNTLVDSDKTLVEIDKPIPEDLNPLSNNNISENSKVTCEQVRDVYHEALPDSPRIRVIGNVLKKQIKAMIHDWPQYNKERKEFTLESFRDYLNYLKRNYSWFLKPYKNENGTKKINNLTTITREKNIVRVINGEFSAT